MKKTDLRICASCPKCGGDNFFDPSIRTMAELDWNTTDCNHCDHTMIVIENTVRSMNNCDGCGQGLPVNKDGDHIDPSSWTGLLGCSFEEDGGGFDHIEIIFRPAFPDNRSIDNDKE